MLAEDHISVSDDVEDATAALDQLGLNAEFLVDGCDQTGRTRLVISLYAVFDGDFHGFALVVGK